MTVLNFVDTNVLLYSATARLDEPAKHQIAYDLVSSIEFGTSAQVLQEFYLNAARKTKPRPTAEQVQEWVSWLSSRPFVPTDVTLIRSAIATSERYQISYWDAAILAAAERLGASILYTEDLNHGQRYGSVLVQNPFRDP